MSTIITWGLVAFLILSLTLSIRRALRGGTRRRTLLIDALLGNLPLAVLVGGLTTVPWNTGLPVAVCGSSPVCWAFSPGRSPTGSFMSDPPSSV